MLILILGLATAALAVSDDPLISLSYLTGVFKQQILDEAQTQITAEVSQAQYAIDQQVAAIGQYSDQGSSGFTGFVKFTLGAGETLYFSPGSEVLLLSGSASVDSGSLNDSTAGVVIGPAGEITLNHLCIGIAEGSLRANESVEIMLCE